MVKHSLIRVAPVRSDDIGISEEMCDARLATAWRVYVEPACQSWYYPIKRRATVAANQLKGGMPWPLDRGIDRP